MDDNYLQHYGVLGMKWGVRKGASGSVAGKARIVSDYVSGSKSKRKDLNPRSSSNGKLKSRITTKKVSEMTRTGSKRTNKLTDKAEAAIRYNNANPTRKNYNRAQKLIDKENKSRIKDIRTAINSNKYEEYVKGKQIRAEHTMSTIMRNPSVKRAMLDTTASKSSIKAGQQYAYEFLKNPATGGVILNINGKEAASYANIKGLTSAKTVKTDDDYRKIAKRIPERTNV